MTSPMAPFRGSSTKGIRTRNSGGVCGRSGRLELAVPIEEVAPALMQEVGWEGAPVLLQQMGRRLTRQVARIHAALHRQSAAFEQIAGRAGGHDVLPCRAP